MSRNEFVRRFLKLGLCVWLLLAAAIAASAQVPGYGQVCGDASNENCTQSDGFYKPHNLTFITGRAEPSVTEPLMSEWFYAVILESVKASSATPCNFISEAKRIEAQELFPNNKVFASRNDCAETSTALETAVLYEGLNYDFNFMAIYGGKTKAEAEKVLKKAQKKYPSANVRRMRVKIIFNGDV